MFKKIIFFIVFFFITFSFFAIDFRDPAYVDCSNEEDLYRYVTGGWKVEKVLHKGDFVKEYKGFKYYYGKDEPQIILFKEDKIKALNFGYSCSVLEGAELNYSRKKYEYN